MKLMKPFSIISVRERLIHSIIWTVGLILINIPDWKVTMGPFYSGDYSLIIPSLYGVVFNIYLFYQNSQLIVALLRKNTKAFFKKSIGLFLIISLLESLLDTGYFFAFYQELSLALVVEIFWGQILMNGIFFYLPSFIYGFAKAWISQGNNLDESNKISLKNGTETVHIPVNDLTHIESDGNYCVYHTDKKILIRQTLVQAEETLPEFFIRCHKSYVTNATLVEKQTYSTLIIGDIKIPVGRKYRAVVKDYFK